jgi:hypothetical protein
MDGFPFSDGLLRPKIRRRRDGCYTEPRKLRKAKKPGGRASMHFPGAKQLPPLSMRYKLSACPEPAIA